MILDGITSSRKIAIQPILSKVEAACFVVIRPKEEKADAITYTLD